VPARKGNHKGRPYSTRRVPVSTPTAWEPHRSRFQSLEGSQGGPRTMRFIPQNAGFTSILQHLDSFRLSLEVQIEFMSRDSGSRGW
jgi:hypothetical protein